MLWVSFGGLGLSAIVAGTRWLRRLLGKVTGLTVLAAHALTHTRTEPEAGPDTLTVDEKAASWKELEEVADWAYQSILAVHLCRLILAQKSDVLVVDCLRSCLEGCLSRSGVVGERQCLWVCLVADLLSRRVCLREVSRRTAGLLLTLSSLPKSTVRLPVS